MNDADSTFFSAAVEPTVTVFEPALVPIGQRAGPLHTGDRHVSAIDPPVLCTTQMTLTMLAPPTITSPWPASQCGRARLPQLSPPQPDKAHMPGLRLHDMPACSTDAAMGHRDGDAGERIAG